MLKNVKIIALDERFIPKYETEGAAGADLKSAESGLIPSGEFKLVSTGIKIELPKGYEAQIRPRSGLAFKKGVTVLNSPGTIDSDYRGEIKVLLINHGPHYFEFKEGDRIAQIVIKKVEQPNFTKVNEFIETVRGDRGFGSTGGN